jgi:hypothetical protein
MSLIFFNRDAIKRLCISIGLEQGHVVHDGNVVHNAQVAVDGQV